MTTTRKKPQQQESMQSIAGDTSISKTFRLILAKCPKQETIPVRLATWAHELLVEGRKIGMGDKKISAVLVNYSLTNGWFMPQINAVLTDLRLKPVGSGGGIGGSGPHIFVIEDVEHLMQWITGLDEFGLRQVTKREDLERKSAAYILETQVRLSEYDINHWLAQFAKLGTIVEICMDGLRRRKMELKKSMITE